MKEKKTHTHTKYSHFFGTVSESNKNNQSKTDTFSTHLHDSSLPWLGTCTSNKDPNLLS